MKFKLPGEQPGFTKLDALKAYGKGSLAALAIIGAGYALAQLPLWAIMLIIFAVVTFIFGGLR